MSESVRRLFLAAELPRPLAHRLAAIVPAGPGVKRVQPQSIHLTLHFLGDVPEAAISPLCAALDEVRSAPFTLNLGPPGRFPARGPARVLWAGLSPSPALVSLHEACGRAIRSVGLSTESRPFTPHLTLARLGEAADHRLSAEFLLTAQLQPDPFPIERLVLFASERTPAGAVHEPLHTVRLRA